MSFTERDITNESYLRLLVYGPSKGGKTCSVLRTSPGPIFVVNTEKGGLAGAAKLGAKFDGEHCLDWPSMQRTLGQLKKDCSTGSKPRWRTVVLDTFTTFAKIQEEQLVYDASNTQAAWGERDKRLTRMVNALLALDAHVVIISHANREGEVLPACSGQNIKHWMPGQVQDIVWLQVTPGEAKNGLVTETKREFLVNPQGNWLGGARSMTFVGKLDADVTGFIKKAGIKP